MQLVNCETLPLLEKILPNIPPVVFLFSPSRGPSSLALQLGCRKLFHFMQQCWCLRLCHSDLTCLQYTLEAQGILQIDCLSVSGVHFQILECGLTPEPANLGIHLGSEPTLLILLKGNSLSSRFTSTCLTEMPDTGRDCQDCQGSMYNEVMTSTSQRYSPEVWSFAASEGHFANFQFHGWLNFEGSNLEMLHSFGEVHGARSKCSKTVRLEV